MSLRSSRCKPLRTIFGNKLLEREDTHKFWSTGREHFWLRFLVVIHVKVLVERVHSQLFFAVVVVLCSRNSAILAREKKDMDFQPMVNCLGIYWVITGWFLTDRNLFFFTAFVFPDVFRGKVRQCKSGGGREIMGWNENT